MTQSKSLRLPITVLIASIVIITALWMLWKWDTGRSNSANPTPSTTQIETTPTANPNSESSGALASFFVISDVHINAGLPDQSNHLRVALDDIKTFGDQAQAIIMTGDNTDTGTADDYKALEKILSAYKLPPIYANMGNHDYYGVWINEAGAWSQSTFPNGKTDAMAREAFMKMFKVDKPYSAVELNGVQFILMSQEVYVQERPGVGEGAWYSDEQMDWLRDTLANNKDGKPVFVMIHQELPAKGTDGGTHRLMKAKKFREILAPYSNVFVFSGHTHQDFTLKKHYIKETFHWFKNSSVGRVYNNQYKLVRQDAAQGMFVEVFADKVVVRGREFSNKAWVPEATWTIPLKK